MPLKIPINKSADYFVTASAILRGKGVSLQAGQGVAVHSSDLATVIVKGDATPRTAPNGTKAVASGTFQAIKVTNTTTPVLTVTASVLNTRDGSPAKYPDGSPIPPLTDTITVQAGLTKPEGSMFGVTAA
jgi:hypothetical protein